MNANALVAAAPRSSVVSPVPLLRRALATAAFAATFAVWVHEERFRDPAVLTLYGPLLLAAILLHFDHVLAQVVVRTVAWVHLAVGAVAALGAGALAPALIAAGSGAALLALGSAPLATEAVRRQFSPIGYRRMFFFACVTLLASAYVMALIGYGYLQSPFAHRRMGVLTMLESALLLASVFGVLRMRAWGIFAAVIAAAGAFAVAALTAVPAGRGFLGVAAYAHRDVRMLFGAAAASALVMVSPIVVSWLRPARPTDATARPVAPWLHSALVVATLVMAAVGAVRGGR